MPFVKDSQDRDIVPIFIDGAALPIDGSRIHPVIGSTDDRTLHYYAAADRAACDRACEAAWKTFVGEALATGANGWRRVSAETRRDILLGVAHLYNKRRAELVEAQVAETNCPEAWAEQNVNLSIKYLKEIASRISSIHGEIPPIEKEDTFAFVFKEPIGPILCIPPWNAALVLATRALASAIGAGCTVVLKASELCPYTHSLIVDIFHEAKLPKGVLNSLSTDRSTAAEITTHLIANPHIRKIEFIGSAAVGREIGAVAAKHLKPILMELGGKCPALVLQGADLHKAANLCAQGATLHHGQICFSTERIIVQKSIAKEFQPLLLKAIKDQPPARAVSASFAEKGSALLQHAASSPGAKFLTGFPTLSTPASLTPSIILIDTSKDPNIRLIDEESFTPSASLYVVNDDIEAIRVANSSSYGLNATIHCNDMERAMKVARELEAGQVHVNSSSVFTSATGPQGGVKGSGWGRQNAKWGLEEFLVEKFVTWHGRGGA
ncbi:hypothetical protein M409DRAFT_68281 [Zasmidium cellare ATCC 36951]|uniref:Aldehyde dehydrogenase domain-containing protein n=1 Tax=Zasmidium cellare ATCC 36951 TaxID=1080233 RepID=A0A6A6C919_ZASCE|nr:uncharacterized protein M409DRAFT_68281 [Zasmidium cellare ATCC 36951]KAF2163677.1 hypothetical protein M409DRAFT_68281 [Zasmidium cellare ATCC 36951]